MPNLLFIDSNSAGTRAFNTARRLGCQSTLVVPGSGSILQASGWSPAEIRQMPDGPETLIEVPALDDSLYDLVAGLHERAAFDAVLTTADSAAEAANELALRLGLPANDRAAMHAACFKHLCRARLDRAGLDNARTAVSERRDQVPQAAAEVGYPCIVKPTRATAKAGVAILTDGKDAADYARGGDDQPGPWLIEEYLDGELYSAEVLCVDQPHLLGITHRRRDRDNPLLEAAAVFPAELDADRQQAVQRFVRELFGALELTLGIFHVEFIYTARGPILVEVNARMMGGSAPLSYLQVTGTDPYELLINAHLSPDSIRVPATFTGGSVAFVLGARRAGLAPPTFEDELGELAASYRFLHQKCSLRNNAPVVRMVGNLTAVGGFCNYYESSAAAEQKYLEFVAGVERILRLPLVKPGP